MDHQADQATSIEELPAGFDRETLARVTGSNEALTVEIVAMFRLELATRRREITACAARRDLRALTRHVHQLAGGAAYCGALSLVGACRRLEHRAELDPDFEAIEPLTDAVLREVDDLV